MKKILIGGCSLLFLCALCIGGSYFLIANRPDIAFNWALQPKDLGQSFTEEDRIRVDEEFGFKVEELEADTPIGESIVYSSPTEVNREFTNAEVMAQIDKWYQSWQYTPIKDVQYRANEDGSIEASGYVVLDRLYNYARFAGYADSDITQAQEYLDQFGVNEIPVYVNINGSITDNQSDFSFNSIQVGIIPIPMGSIGDTDQLLNSLITDKVIPMTGADIQTLEISNGQTNLVGEIPGTISAMSEN